MTEQEFDESKWAILQALGDIAGYNGHDEEIKQVIDYIKSDNEEYEFVIGMPEFLRNNDCDYFINILWQLTVMLYGDYGTSPRYGWLEGKNKEKILEMWEYIYHIANGE